MSQKIKSWFRSYPEISLFAVALMLWLGMGLLLAPFSATYGLAFVHKLTVFLARLAASVSATMLLVRYLFPTLRQFRQAHFRAVFNAPDVALTPWDKQRALTVVAVYLLVWLGVILALSL